MRADVALWQAAFKITHTHTRSLQGLLGSFAPLLIIGPTPDARSLTEWHDMTSGEVHGVYLLTAV
jgi:hypothetical protein